MQQTYVLTVSVRPDEGEARKFEYPMTDEGKVDVLKKKEEAERSGFPTRVGIMEREEVTVS